MKQVAILGSGVVGQTLASGFLKHGYGAVMGTKHPDKKPDLSLPGLTVTTYEEAAKSADMAVLAVKGTAAEDVVRAVAPDIAGKIVMDATNPIADAPPAKGVLKFFTSLDESLMERLQGIAPQAQFVKAFSSVGNALMVDPDLGGIRPTMFICGNSESSKQEVASILHSFGWDVEDMGAAEAARAIEPLCILWCIPGFLRNDWSHAFKLLRK
ncbi:MAG: NAD(P)-binding domain-containing protein [Acidobacteria bacterium]|nr:NAD(P)-binding domain-containing protein [Acidobacteriota bacterium]